MNWPFRRPAARPAARTTPRPPTLRMDALEDRCTPATLNPVFTPNAFGGGAFDPFDNPAVEVRSASADVNGDGVADIITAEGPGGGSRVRIFDGAAARFGSQAVLIADFFAYSDVAGAGQTPGFAGGVFVAAGDFNGDGFAEVVTSPGAGASGHLKVFDFNNGGTFAGNNPALRASFFAYPGFLGEIRVTTLDRPGQTPLLVTASGAGTTQSDVRLYDNAFGIGEVGAGALVPPLVQTFPFPGYLGGVSVAGGSNGQLFVSPNVGESFVQVFNFAGGANGTSLTPGITLQTGFTSPTDVRLGAADIDGDGFIDPLVSSIGLTGASPITGFSLGNGLTGVSTLNTLTGFQGFGFFGNSFLGSGAFTGVPIVGGTGLGGTTLGGVNALAGANTFGGLPGFGGFGGATGTGAPTFGLVAPGTTQGLIGGGFVNNANFATPAQLAVTTGSAPFNNVTFGSTPGVGAFGSTLGGQINGGTLAPGII